MISWLWGIKVECSDLSLNQVCYIYFLSVNTTSLKKVKLNIESLHSAKLKEEKALKSGKKSVKGKSVKMDLDKVKYVISLLYNQI